VALSRKDAALQVLAAELQSRQKDVDDMRALLMRQVDDMRSISTEMKEDFGRLLRESDERMSSKCACHRRCVRGCCDCCGVAAL
jgi:hypothetical protein